MTPAIAFFAAALTIIIIGSAFTATYDHVVERLTRRTTMPNGTYVTCPECLGAGEIETTTATWNAREGQYYPSEHVMTCVRCDGIGALDLEEFGPIAASALHNGDTWRTLDQLNARPVPATTTEVAKMRRVEEGVAVTQLELLEGLGLIERRDTGAWVAKRS